MGKNILYLITIVAILTLVSCNFNALETKERRLAVVNLPKKDYTIGVFYQPSNATIQSAIQIRKVTRNGATEEVLKNFERYNYVDTFYLKNDSVFCIVVRDTASILGNKPDTINFILK